MDKKEHVVSKPLQLNRALELQALIVYFFRKYIDRPVNLKTSKWDLNKNEDPDLLQLRGMAISKGYREEDFEERNRMIEKKSVAIRPIKNLHKGLIATYVTSSNYYNTPLRRHLNPVQQFDEPLTMSMTQVIEKFRRQSEEAAYSFGDNLEGSESAMKLQGRLSISFSILLLKNLLLERKRKGITFRGVKASSQFVALLDYYSQQGTVVTIDQFLSTTTNPVVARDFSVGKYDSCTVLEGDKRVVFIVEGTSGAEISAWLDEGEVLYPPEIYFQVCPVSTFEKIRYLNATFGVYVYKLKEVPALGKSENTPFLTDIHKMQR